MFVLDTDTYTHLVQKHPRVVARVSTAYEQGERVAITIITKAEILRGRIDALLKADSDERFLFAQQHLVATEEALQEIRVLTIDASSLRCFHDLKDLRGLKKTGRADLLIGSIVLASDATLATRNQKHFRAIPRLKITNWVD